ncbi:MAG: sulfotransferase [Bacteroidota bacterium]
MDYQPVIIIGAARSGTNMLRDIITQIPDFGTWDCDEINPIWRHGNINHPHDEFYAHMATPKIARFIRGEFLKIAQSEKVSNVVEKSCANSLRVEFIDKILPNAKYVFIFRDGRDTVASAAIRWNAKFELGYTLKKLRYVPLVDIPFYAYRFGMNRIKQFFLGEKQLGFWGVQIKNIQQALQQYSLLEVCGLQWRDCVEKSTKDFQTISSDRILKIQYETFVTKPIDEMNRLLAFLNIDANEVNVSDLTKRVSSKSIGKYKKQLTPEDQRKITTLLAPTLTNLGYKI